MIILNEIIAIDADLRGANLEGAYLRGAIGIIAVQFCGFCIYIQADKSQIGCKYLANSDWLEMDDDEAIKLGAFTFLPPDDYRGAEGFERLERMK